MDEKAEQREPVWEVLEHQGRTLTWLARATGRPRWWVNEVKIGYRPADDAWRAECAKVLGVPEHFLFLSADRSFARTNGRRRKSQERR